jgi:hypothetical protein
MHPTNTDGPPKVFLSYSHESATHQERVLALADRLRQDGIDAMVDQYVPAPLEGWPRWTDRQISEADFVLLVCTETYLLRVEGREHPGKGHGVLWEGHLVYQHLYNSGVANAKFIPVLLQGGDPLHIPLPLQAVTHYCPGTEEDYEQLYRRLTNQPRSLKPGLGKLRSLPPLSGPRDLSSVTAPVGNAGTGFKTNVGALPNTETLVLRSHTTHLHRLLIGIGALIVFVLLGYVGWKNAHRGRLAERALYRVRIIVRDAQMMIVNDAKVTSSLGGEPMKADGGWQFAIPAEGNEGKKLTVYANVPNTFLQGSQEVWLTGDYNPTAVLDLRPLPSVQARGTVKDEAFRTVAGARVSIAGYGTESVTTQADGTFTLPAHAAEGQHVEFHAEKPGYMAISQWHLAGDDVTLQLKRR